MKIIPKLSLMVILLVFPSLVTAGTIAPNSGFATTRELKEMAKEASWFNQTQLLAFYNELLREIPPDKDHYLFDIPKKYTKFVLAGLRLHRANLLKEKGDKFAYEVTFQSFRDLLRTE